MEDRGGVGFFVGAALEFEGGFGEMAECIEDAYVGARVFGEFGLKGGRVELGEESVHAGDGDAETGLIEELSVWLFDDDGGEIEASAHFVKPGLFAEPILKATGMPAGEGGQVEAVSALLESFEDGTVGGAIAEHAVEKFARFGGQPGDFAVTTDGVGGCFGRALRYLLRVHTTQFFTLRGWM